MFSEQSEGEEKNSTLPRTGQGFFMPYINPKMDCSFKVQGVRGGHGDDPLGAGRR
jgi:hypothetical protein